MTSPSSPPANAGGLPNVPVTFSGVGGLDLGLERAGFRCVGQVECDPFCRRVLAKNWPDVPRFDDVRTFTKESISGPIDLIAGGFPCQDISNTGGKQGLAGEQSGLWSEYRRILREIRPRCVLIENVAALLIRGMERILFDLAGLGFDAEWSVVSACAMGAPHTRERVFIVAYPEGSGWFGPSLTFAGGSSPDDGEAESLATVPAGRRDCDGHGRWWVREPAVARMVDGTAAGMDGPNRSIGRAVVPQISEFIGRRILASMESEAA